MCFISNYNASQNSTTIKQTIAIEQITYLSCSNIYIFLVLNIIYCLIFHQWQLAVFCDSFNMWSFIFYCGKAANSFFQKASSSSKLFDFPVWTVGLSCLQSGSMLLRKEIVIATNLSFTSSATATEELTWPYVSDHYHWNVQACPMHSTLCYTSPAAQKKAEIHLCAS